jgi:hypothetical protein
MELIVAIHEYLKRSEFAVRRLQALTGQNDLMRAWREGVIKRSGEEAELSYEFHGSGVYIEAGPVNIDVDFLPGGSLGGFDSWRLWQMIKQNPSFSQAFHTHDQIKSELIKLCEKKQIICVQGTNMYMLPN